MSGHEGRNEEDHQENQTWVSARYQERRLVKDKDTWSSEYQINETVVLQEAAPKAEVQKEPLETDQEKIVIVEKWMKSQKETTMKSTQR